MDLPAGHVGERGVAAAQQRPASINANIDGDEDGYSDSDDDSYSASGHPQIKLPQNMIGGNNKGRALSRTRDSVSGPPRSSAKYAGELAQLGQQRGSFSKSLSRRGNSVDASINGAAEQLGRFALDPYQPVKKVTFDPAIAMIEDGNRTKDSTKALRRKARKLSGKSKWANSPRDNDPKHSPSLRSREPGWLKCPTQGILKRTTRRETYDEAMYRIMQEGEQGKRLLQAMVDGARIIKCNRAGRAFARWFYVSADGTHLHWANKARPKGGLLTPKGGKKSSSFKGMMAKMGKTRRRNLADVVGVHYGPYSDGFSRYLDKGLPDAVRSQVPTHQQPPRSTGAGGQPWLCVTVDFNDRTLDLICKNEQEASQWFLGIQALAPLSSFYLTRGAMLWQRLVMKLNYYGFDPIRVPMPPGLEEREQQRLATIRDIRDRFLTSQDRDGLIPSIMQSPRSVSGMSGQLSISLNRLSGAHTSNTSTDNSPNSSTSYHPKAASKKQHKQNAAALVDEGPTAVCPPGSSIATRVKTPWRTPSFDEMVEREEDDDDDVGDTLGPLGIPPRSLTPYAHASDRRVKEVRLKGNRNRSSPQSNSDSSSSKGIGDSIDDAPTLQRTITPYFAANQPRRTSPKYKVLNAASAAGSAAGTSPDALALSNERAESGRSLLFSLAQSSQLDEADKEPQHFL